VAVDLLLEPAAALVDGGGGEFDDVERVEDRAGVGELVVDGVLVAVERVQRRLFHTATELLSAGGEPVAVGLPGLACDQVQQPRPRPPVRLWGQVDHSGQALRPAHPDRSGVR
jgi:hypothetical protein